MMGVGFSEYLFSSAIYCGIFARFRPDANSVSHSVFKNLWQSMELFMGHAVAQLVEALRYKPQGRGFNSRWCHWNFSLT